MKFLLDTNTCIHFLNRTHTGIGQRVISYGRKSIGTSSIVIEELLYGAYRSARLDENLQQIHLFATAFDVRPFDMQAAHESARIRSHLATIGQAIGPFDNLIAAVALAQGATLVTHNLREFQRVPELRIEDWQRSGTL